MSIRSRLRVIIVVPIVPILYKLQFELVAINVRNCAAHSLLLRLFGVALLPALAIKEITFTALPRKFLGSDGHVFRKGGLVTVRVLVKDKRIGDREPNDGQGNRKRIVQPFPHFVDIVVAMCLGGDTTMLSTTSKKNLSSVLQFGLVDLSLLVPPRCCWRVRVHAAA